MATRRSAEDIQIYDETAGLPERPQTGYSYDLLVEMFPDEDLVRRELIDGELFVTPSPIVRHQEVVMRVAYRLFGYAERHGGTVLVGPMDVRFSDVDVVEPDVLYVAPDHSGRVEKRFISSAPDLVVEVSSPSTRRLDGVRKRALYERFGVPEYWFVDLDSDRIEIDRLSEGRYGDRIIAGRGDGLTSPQLPGFELDIDYVLGSPQAGP